MEKVIRTLEELSLEAEAFVVSLAPQEGGATLVTLSGELGAGKTAFVKAIANALGVKESVTSPTFVLEKIYTLEHPVSKFRRLVHIDAYRLQGPTELAPLGFDELMKEPGNLILLEWPEKAGLGGASDEPLTKPVARITLAANTDGTHTISYG